MRDGFQPPNEPTRYLPPDSTEVLQTIFPAVCLGTYVCMEL